MIWSREEYLAHMTFEDIGREFFTELFGPLVGLPEEWRAQGASEQEVDLSAFGWDSVRYAWLPVRTGAITGLTPRVLEDTPEYTLSVDSYGRTVKLIKSSATIPLPLAYPVRNMDDWLKIRHWYTFREDRVPDRETLHAYARKQKEGCLILAGIPGGFDEARQLMGDAELCVAYYEQPELVRDILDTVAETALQVFERIADTVTVDLLHVHEDMAGKSGPLAGPVQVRTFIAPYYRRIWEPLHSSGATLFSQDSDGDIRPIMDDLLAGGLNVLYPCEPAAGMDMVELRRRYGKRVAFKGGIDKHALRGTRADIEAELQRKLRPALRGGGTVFALDHRIPNGVPIANYRYYVSRGRELLGLPPAFPAPFVRMAF